MIETTTANNNLIRAESEESMMDSETKHQTNHQYRRLPKGERRVRFADSMGMELVSIFLFDLISNYYFASIHSHQQHSLAPQKPSLLPSSPSHSSLASSSSSSSSSNSSSSSSSSAPPALPSSRPSAFTSSSLQPTTHLNSNNTTDINNSRSSSPLTKSSLPPSVLSSQSTSISNNYVCQFTQPISLISFKERVKLNKVHLETCSVDSRAGNISVSCTIRVLNTSYDKAVIVRYTTDEWHTHTDSLASYKPGSCDGWSDRFTSTFSVTNQVKQFQTGQRIIFAVRYTYNGDQVHWDNNGGLNYTVKKF